MLAKLNDDGLDNVHGEAAQVGFTKSNRQDKTTEPRGPTSSGNH